MGALAVAARERAQDGRLLMMFPVMLLGPSCSSIVLTWFSGDMHDLFC
jgi:hypothetical protein